MVLARLMCSSYSLFTSLRFCSALLLYPLMIQIFTKTSAKKFLVAMKKPQAVALSTASSMATLPVTMETVEKELGVQHSTASFVLSFGRLMINMSGNGIYYGLVAIFFAQLFNIDLSGGCLRCYHRNLYARCCWSSGCSVSFFPSGCCSSSSYILIEGLPLLFVSRPHFRYDSYSSEHHG